MRNQIASEFRKLLHTRTTWSLVVGLLAIVAISVVGILATSSVAVLTVPFVSQSFLVVPMSVASVFVLILAIRSFTDEFRYGSIMPTLLAEPDRRRVLFAKLVVMAAAAVGMAVAASGLAIAIGVPWLLAKGVVLAVSAAPMALWAGKLLLTVVLWSAAGVGLGLAVRHQVGAIVGALVWITVGENLLSGFAPGLSKYLPSTAAQAIGSVGHNILSPAGGAIVFTAWAIFAVVVGMAVMQRRDIG
jgi:ABC-2 type transport system permease protein